VLRSREKRGDLQKWVEKKALVAVLMVMMTSLGVKMTIFWGRKFKPSFPSMTELTRWSYLLPSFAKTNKRLHKTEGTDPKTNTLSGGDIQHPKKSLRVTTNPAMPTPATTAR
jgi:hypothetical protein